MRVAVCAALLLVGACGRREPPERIEAALVSFVRALDHALADSQLQALPPPEAGRRLEVAMAPARAELAPMTRGYRALSEVDRKKLHFRVSTTTAREQRAILARASVLSQGKDYARALPPALRPWKDSDTLWAFALFSSETVEELEELLE